MRALLSWLKDFTPLNLSNEDLSDVLTLAGLEVDKVERTPFSFTEVVVAEIKEVKQHPNADKLKVAQVFDGTETVQIVCGDPKCAAGMKVALATIGGTLTDKEGKVFKMKKSKLRDVESFGMLCAGDELGLAEHSDGIMTLDADAPVGTDLTELLGDVIFEISLTPNLGRCMSQYGIAREIAALLDQKANLPAVNIETGETRCDVSVEVKDPDDCRRYCCRKVRGIKVGPSPDWLATRLENCGVRSINNVVDVTNYIMLEIGQPLHAFDAKKVLGQKIVVAASEKEIPFETLDGEKRKVPPGILMIHDAKGPIAVAGVMGGANSEVDEKTTEIILEAACFDPSAVRKGSKALGVRSESSARFEKGVDFEQVKTALDRAAALIQTLAGGSIDAGEVDCIQKEKKRKQLKLRLARCNALLGTTLSLNEVASFLRRLEMEVKTEGETLHVTVPTYRNDIHGEIDLIEEVARIYGYNNIEKKQAPESNSSLPHSPLYLVEKEVRGRLIASGLQEFLTCDLISPKLAALSLEKHLGEKEEIHVIRPSSVDQSILRTSLLPGMLQAVKHNFDRQTEDLAAFEIGHIHFKDGNDYRERLSAAILLTGKRRPYHWEKKAEETDFFELKGIIENLLEGFHIDDVSISPSHLKSFHPGIQGEISSQGLRLGALGEVHPDRLKKLGIVKRVYFAQLDLHDLLQVAGKTKKMSPLPQYPGSERDWTITCDRHLPMGTLFDAIKAFPSKLLKAFSLLDVYESEKIGKEKKNITLRFTYRSDKQTIEQPQVDKEHNRLTEEIQKKFRDFIS